MNCEEMLNELQLCIVLNKTPVYPVTSSTQDLKHEYVDILKTRWKLICMEIQKRT